MGASAPFWKTKGLAEMTDAEWESLCDGCGRCCLHKLRDDDTDEIHYTDVACRLLDIEAGGCSDYARRQRKVLDCVRLTPESPGPDRLAAALLRLSPLGRGARPRLVASAGVGQEARACTRPASRCAGGRSASVRAGPLEHHVVDWPGRLPRAIGRDRAPAAPVIRRLPAGDLADRDAGDR